MPLAWKDRIKVASATTGTGTLTLGAAASGYRTFAVLDDGKRFDIVIEDGTAWETARNCLYTHSGTTLTRGTFSDSSTGSVLSLSGAENVFVDLVAGRQTANELADQTYICGLLVTKHTGANTLDISAGSCYDPSSNKIINYAGVSGLSAGTLGASQWNQVYLYDNAGTVTPEVTNNANPPSTAYAGTARQGGTNSNRRWIGSFLTDGSSNIYTQGVTEAGANRLFVQWLVNNGVSPFRVLNGATATTYTATSLAGCVPRYMAEQITCRMAVGYVTTGGADASCAFSVDGSVLQGFGSFYAVGTATFPQFNINQFIESATPQIYYKVNANSPGVGPAVYLDVIGYTGMR